MSTTDLSQQHVLPDKAHALPTNTLVDETARLASAHQSGLGGPAAGTAGSTGTSTAEDLKESARRQVEARLRTSQADAGSSSLMASSNPTTDLQQQHAIPTRSTALPTNSLVNETARLSLGGSSGLGGSSVQTVGNTSASFTPHTASDANTSAHAVAPADAGPKVALEGQHQQQSASSSALPREQAGLLSDQIPVPVKNAAAQASDVLARQMEAAKQGLDHAFNKDDTITPGHELPGGWGPTPPASTTGPNATTTIYQDISTALNTVGQAAYNAVPASLIGKLHSGPAVGSSPVRTTTNTVPHQQPSAPGAAHAHPTTTEDISNAVKDGAAGLQENAKLAADKVAELGKTAYNAIPAMPSPFAVGHSSTSNTAPAATDRDVGPTSTPAKGAVANLPSPASIIPHSKDATSGNSLATTELPTLQDIKAEAVHIVDNLKHMVGLGGATAVSESHSHEVAAVDKGPKVDLLSSSHEIAPVAGANSVQSSASATRGEVTPGEVKTTPLAGGGGLAATIADDVADAARHSSATSVGESAPGGREDPRAGAGGLAATIADEVADAARHSSATSVGGSTGTNDAAKGGLAATIAPEVARAAQHSSATHPHEGLGGSSLTGEQSPLAGGGGLAATIADDVARAAKESPATSVGATGANAVPVAAEGHHGQHGQQTQGSAAENLHLGRPVNVVAGTLAGLAGAGGLAAAGAHHASSGHDSTTAIPEARETSHSPAALQHGNVPTSSTGPTNVLSSATGTGSTSGPAAFGDLSGAGAGLGAGAAAASAGHSDKSPSSALEAAKTSHRDDAPSASVPKVVESDGPHGLIKTADGSYKHRHELSEVELAEHDRQQKTSSTSSAAVGNIGSAASSGTAAHPKGVDAGSSVPPHRGIDTATANKSAGLGATTGSGHSATPLSPAKSTASDSSTTPSGHKKKQSLSEKLKHALHLDK